MSEIKKRVKKNCCIYVQISDEIRRKFTKILKIGYANGVYQKDTNYSHISVLVG